MLRLKSLYSILTEDDKSWGSDETKERVWAARANKLWKRNEEIIWGSYWKVGVILVKHIQGDAHLWWRVCPLPGAGGRPPRKFTPCL